MYRKAVGCLDQRGTQFKTVSLRRTVCQSLKATHVIQCIFSGKLKNKFKWAKLTKASNVFRFFHRAFDLKTSTCSKHLSRAKVQRRKRQEQKLIHSLTSRITGYRVCEKEACLRQSDLFWAIHFTPFENVWNNFLCVPSVGVVLHKGLLEPLGQDHLREEVFCVGIPQTSTVLPDTDEGITNRNHLTWVWVTGKTNERSLQQNTTLDLMLCSRTWMELTLWELGKNLDSSAIYSLWKDHWAK